MVFEYFCLMLVCWDCVVVCEDGFMCGVAVTVFIVAAYEFE